MKTLLHPNQVPPGGYFYKDADTGFFIGSGAEGILLNNVLRKAREHRAANHLPIPDDFDAQCIDKMCEKYGRGWCADSTQREKAPLLTRVMGKIRSAAVDIHTLFKGTQAMLALLGGKTASVEEMQSRAAVCKACPLRTTSQGCFGCSSIRPVTERVLGPVRLSQSVRALGKGEKAHACGACGCYLPAKIWLSKEKSLEYLKPATEARLHANCWLLKEKAE